MAGDKVTLELMLTANDKMSPALALATLNIDRFKNQGNHAFDGIQEGGERSLPVLGNIGTAFAGIGVKLLEMGITSVMSSIHALSSALDDAGKFQTRTLMTTSDIATQLGVAFEDAGTRVEGMQTKLSKAAASLPGTTQDYVDLFNTLGGTSATVFKGRPDEWANQTEDLVKRIGVLSAGSIGSGHGSEVGSVIARAISGSSGFGELAVNDIIQKNTLFRQAILNSLAKLGVEQDKWKDLTSEQRFQILSDAAKQATPDSLIKRFNGTYENVTEGFKSYWFDPTSGVFGVLKKVNVGNGGGLRSLLQSWTETISAMGALGSAALDAVGFDADAPMRTLINFLDGFNNFIRNAAAAIRLAPFKDGNLGNLEEMQAIVGNFINNAIESFSLHVAQFDVGSAADTIHSIMDGMSSLISGIHWGELGLMAGFALGKLIVLALDTVFSTQFAKFALTVLAAVVKLVGGLLLGVSGGLVKELADGFDNFWDTFFKGIGDLLKIWVSKVGDFLQGIWSKVQGIASGIGNFVTNPVQAITNTVVNGAKQIPGVGAALNQLDKWGLLGGKSDTNGLTGAEGNPISVPTNTLPKPNVQNSSTTNTTKQAFAPVFNVNTSDPKDAANEVLKRLGEAYGNYRAGMA